MQLAQTVTHALLLMNSSIEILKLSSTLQKFPSIFFSLKYTIWAKVIFEHPKSKVVRAQSRWLTFGGCLPLEAEDV